MFKASFSPSSNDIDRRPLFLQYVVNAFNTIAPLFLSFYLHRTLSIEVTVIAWHGITKIVQENLSLFSARAGNIFKVSLIYFIELRSTGSSNPRGKG